MQELADGTITVEIQDRIQILRLNRPDKKNALLVAMYQALVDAMKAAEADDAVRAVIITGSEECFTSGNDVMDFMTAPPSDDSSPVAQFLAILPAFTKPLIAAVEGNAIGIGTTLLLHCDLVYAGNSSKFRMPFVNLGLCPEAASSYLLPAIMGTTRASELLLLGEVFTADKAKEYGIINEITDAGAALDAALKAAATLAKQPPAALRLSKSLIRRGSAQAIAEAMKVEGQEFMARLVSPEAAEAFSAFAERREPNFDAFS